MLLFFLLTWVGVSGGKFGKQKSFWFCAGKLAGCKPHAEDERSFGGCVVFRLVWFGFVGLGWVQSEDKVLRSAIMLSYISFDQFNPITVHFFQHGPSFHSDPLSAIRMELDLDLYLFPLLIGGGGWVGVSFSFRGKCRG